MNTGTPILVAEDEESDAFFLGRAFEKAGLNIQLIVAQHGEEAIRYLSGEFPYCDRSKYPLPLLMLLDLKMPIKNGFDVLAWLSTQPDLKGLPVIALTSSGLEDDRERSLRLGASEYHIKPSALEDLVKLVAGIHSRWILGAIPCAGVSSDEGVLKSLCPK